MLKDAAKLEASQDVQSLDVFPLVVRLKVLGEENLRNGYEAEQGQHGRWHVPEEEGNRQRRFHLAEQLKVGCV